MAYVITNTRGQIVAVVEDGTVDNTATPLSIIGKNVTPFGQLAAENLIYQLENFANSTAPGNPIEGQFWFNTVEEKPYVWTGEEWKALANLVVATSTPATDPKPGDLWFDSNALKLFVYNGTTWTLIGPQAVEGFGITQWTSTSLPDDSLNDHAVILGQVDGEVVCILSLDAFVISASSRPAGFVNLVKGLNFSATATISGTVSQANTLAVARTINGVAFDGSQNITVNNVNDLSPGNYISGSTYNGASNQTWNVDATNINTPNKVVARDASGNFAAGTITGNLTGTATYATSAGSAATVSGIVAAVNGGTGQTSYSAGQILIGNGTGLNKASITGTAPVSVSSSSSGIALSYTGGMGDMINIMNYGASGNGVTDDSAAFASALSASAGRSIYFPKGSYNLQSMTPATGICNIVGMRDAVIKGFNYTDLSAPSQTSGISQPTDAHFTANGLIFEGTTVIPGLTIKNQSQSGVIRSGDVINCSFYDGIGLVLDNCQGCRINNCDFFDNTYGIKNLSSTNNVFSNCNFYRPIIGVQLDASADDTAARLGGENAKFVGCMWIDGVTAINAINHNYLWLTSCLIDYMNSGIYLAGSKYAKVDGCYVGYEGTNKSSLPNYIAPLALGSMYATGVQSTNRSSGMTATNTDFVGYFNCANPLVRLDGNGFVGFSGCEECLFTNSKFYSIDPSTNTMQYLLYADFVLDLYVVGGVFYAPNNTTIISPWVVLNENTPRTYIANNFTANVFSP